MLIITLLIIAKTWKQSKHPLMDKWIINVIYIYIYIYTHTQNKIQPIKI